MFLPMSWMSPLTVAMMIGPLTGPDSCEGSAARTTSNAAPAASAAISSCGRKTFPDSNPFPTISSAGTMLPLMMSNGFLPF